MSTRKRQRSEDDTCTTDSSDNAADKVAQCVQQIQGALLERSTRLLVDRISNAQSPHSSAEVVREKIPTGPEALDDFGEEDHVFFTDSVGTLIKRECLARYHKYKKLDDHGKALVILGANSILDMTKGDSVHQTVLTETEYRDLQDQFPQSYCDNLEFLDDYKKKITELEKLARVDLGDARAAANKYEATHKGFSSTLFDFYAEYFKILQFQKQVFSKDLDATEGDLAMKIWGPLMECTMRDEGTLRLKWGGSSGAVESRGCKADVRVVCENYAAAKEIDIGNIELSTLDASVDKIANAKVKLLIATKCVLDQMLCETTAGAAISVPALQLSGLKARLFSLRLASDGLYVAADEGSGTLPSTVGAIHTLKHVYNILLKFKNATVEAADLPLHADIQPDLWSQVGKGRPTWIPPQNDSPTPPLPQYLFETEPCTE